MTTAISCFKPLFGHFSVKTPSPDLSKFGHVYYVKGDKQTIAGIQQQLRDRSTHVCTRVYADDSENPRGPWYLHIITPKTLAQIKALKTGKVKTLKEALKTAESPQQIQNAEDFLERLGQEQIDLD